MTGRRSIKIKAKYLSKGARKIKVRRFVEFVAGPYAREKMRMVDPVGSTFIFTARGMTGFYAARNEAYIVSCRTIIYQWNPKED